MNAYFEAWLQEHVVQYNLRQEGNMFHIQLHFEVYVKKWLALFVQSLKWQSRKEKQNVNITDNASITVAVTVKLH